MRIKLKKLNNRGFAHHLLIPVVAIVMIAGIGTYIITKSHANTIDPGSGTWQTVKSSGNIGTVVYKGTGQNFLSYTLYKGHAYRACVTAVSYKATSSTARISPYNDYNNSVYPTFGTTSKRVCTNKLVYSSTWTTYVNVGASSNSIVVQKVEWQQLY